MKQSFVAFQPSNTALKEEVCQFFQSQLERRNQFPQHNRNDDTIQKEVDLNYGNVCPAVKHWIHQDMKKKQQQQQEKKEETFDVSLLNLLDEDIKFEIIQFIPTYSQWKELKKGEDYLSDIEFPTRIERPFHLSHRVDTNLVTFHKMRLLCKKFNHVMMTRIMHIKQLIIPSKMDTFKFAYMACFLRMQRIYHENHCKLPTDSIYLYSDATILLGMPLGGSNPPRLLEGSTFFNTATSPFHSLNGGGSGNNKISLGTQIGSSVPSAGLSSGMLVGNVTVWPAGTFSNVSPPITRAMPMMTSSTFSTPIGMDTNNDQMTSSDSEDEEEEEDEEIEEEVGGSASKRQCSRGESSSSALTEGRPSHTTTIGSVSGQNFGFVNASSSVTNVGSGTSGFVHAPPGFVNAPPITNIVTPQVVFPNTSSSSSNAASSRFVNASGSVSGQNFKFLNASSSITKIGSAALGTTSGFVHAPPGLITGGAVSSYMPPSFKTLSYDDTLQIPKEFQQKYAFNMPIDARVVRKSDVFKHVMPRAHSTQQPNHFNRLFRAGIPSGVDYAAFIGENTTIERVIVFSEPEYCKPVVNLLKSLKYFDVGVKYAGSVENFDRLEEITCIAPLLNCRPKSKTVRIITFDRNDTIVEDQVGDVPIKATQKKHMSDMMDYFNKIDIGTVLLFLQEYNSCTQAPFTQPTNFFYELTQNIDTVERLESSRKVVEFLYRVNYPIEFASPTFGSLTEYGQALFQYMAYLTNEYQDGRLIPINKSSSQEKLLFQMILYGWHFWKQESELLHIFAPYSYLFSLVASNFGHLLNEMTFSVLVHNLNHADVGKNLGKLLEYNPEAVSRAVVRPVKCANNFSQTIHTPLFGLLARVQYGSFLMERILSGMSAESVANIPKTEQGYNILHVVFGIIRAEDINPSLVIQIMKKAPNFIHEKNNDGFSPYDLLKNFDTCISDIIIKDVGLPRIK